jgi:hypothetical protein
MLDLAGPARHVGDTMLKGDDYLAGLDPGEASTRTTRRRKPLSGPVTSEGAVTAPLFTCPPLLPYLPPAGRLAQLVQSACLTGAVFRQWALVAARRFPS